VPPNDFVSRGQGLVASGQYQEAVKVCRLGLLGRPTQVDGRLVLAQALLALRRYDEVLAEMRVALELDGGIAAAHALKGEALLRKGDMHAAKESLDRARQLAPSDPAVGALIAETDLALSTGGNRLPTVDETADPRTKHYPTHKGATPRPREVGESAGATSSSFTRPEAPSPGPRVPKRVPPNVPERTGTVEIDPEMSGIELVGEEDDLGEAIDPPTGEDTDMRTLESADLTEIDEDDLIDERSESRGGARPMTKGSQEGTVAGRPAAKRSTPPPPGPDLGRLFPDEPSGIEDLLGGPPGASVAPIPLRAPPTGSNPLLPDLPPGATPNRKPTQRPSEDMRMIRAGLGLDPDQKLPKVQEKATIPVGDETGILITDPPPGLRRSDDSVLLDAERDRVLSESRRKERTRKVQTDPGGNRVRAPRRPPWKLILWSALALTVIGGGVYGGFQIREMRLERQVAAARRDADTAAKSDTWRGWRAARDVLEGVARAQSSPKNRAALARARAVLAADFGDDPVAAREAVDALGAIAMVDAEVARAHLALFDGDAARLEAATRALEELAPDSAEADYLAGRAALLAERWEDAIAAFDAARNAEARPAYLLGLAQAHAGRRAWPEARAAIDLALSQHPDHPAAVIERARVVAAAAEADGKLPAEAAGLVTGLERLIAESEKALEEQALGVSPTQAAWAALALAELQVVRGDPAAAKRALERAREAAPADRAFAVGAIHVLLSIGDVPAARVEADKAVKDWSQAAAVHVANAEVSLAEGDAAKAVEALEQAGDLASRPEALALRGQARLALGEVEAATADLDAALSKAPDLEPALVARAELDLAGGNPRAAVTRLEKRHAAGGSSALAVTYAAALRGVGERDRARAVLATLTVAGAPRTSAGRAWLETARLERESGNARAARTAYEQAIELLPDPTGARLEAALLLVDTGDAAGAKESLDRLAAEVEPKDGAKPGPDAGRVLVETARVHVLTGDLDGAKALLDRAENLASSPRWLVARERGRLALRQRSFPVAIEALERAAGLEPSDGEARLLLIDAHLGAGDGPAARRVLEDVQKRFNGMPEMQLAVGRVRLYFEAFEDAREAFVKAKDQLERQNAAPRWIADATYWLGLTTYYSGDPAKARPLVVQAIALDPNVADAHMLLGTIDGDRQQWKSAARSYQKVTQLDPGNTEAWFFLGEAAASSKQPKLARKAFDTYLQRQPNGDLADEARLIIRTKRL
jgi:tetratricopeptide (TPR) repeat protein